MVMERGSPVELKRMIAEVREPGDAEAASEPLANEQETLQSLQMKFEKLKLLSEADKEVIVMLQDRMVQQKRQVDKRRSTAESVQSKFKELATLAQRDRQMLQEQSRRVSLQTDEIHKIREEKITFAKLNEALRKQLKDKQEAFTAAISKQAELESWRKMNDLELKRLKMAVDSEAGESKSKKDEIELLRCNLEQLDSELNGKNAELRNQRLILDELKNEKTILLDQIEMRKTELEQSLSLNVSLQERMEEMSLASRNSQVALIEKDHALAQNSSTISALQKESNAAKTRLKELECNIDVETNRLRGEKNTIAELNGALRCRLDDMQEEHASRLTEAHALTERLQNEAEQREQELKSRTSALKAAHDDIALKTDQLQTLSEEHLKCKKEIKLLNCRNRSLEEEQSRISELESQVEYSRHRNREEAEKNKNKISSLKEALEESQRRLMLADKRQRALEDRSQIVLETEAEVRKALAKILNAQQAMEGSFTCTSCMRLMVEPRVCVPCGHSFCSSCLDSSSCRECEAAVLYSARNKLMDDMSGKLTYSRQVLANLKQRVLNSPLFKSDA